MTESDRRAGERQMLHCGLVFIVLLAVAALIEGVYAGALLALLVGCLIVLILRGSA